MEWLWGEMGAVGATWDCHGTMCADDECFDSVFILDHGFLLVEGDAESGYEVPSDDFESVPVTKNPAT